MKEQRAFDLNEFAYVAEEPVFHYEPSRMFLAGEEPRPARLTVRRRTGEDE